MNAGMKYILELWKFFKRMLRSGRDFVNSEAVLSKWEHKSMPKSNMNLLSPSPTTFEYARKIHCKFVYFSNLKKRWLDC